MSEIQLFRTAAGHTFWGVLLHGNMVLDIRRNVTEYRYDVELLDPAKEQHVPEKPVREATPPRETAPIPAIIEEREKTHGPYSKVSPLAQQLKELFRRQLPGWSNLSMEGRESLDNIASKIGRILAGNGEEIDHWKDIAGYAQLVELDLTRKEAKPRVPDNSSG